MTDLLTTQEVADALGIDYEAARKRLRRAKLLPEKTVGRNHFWSPDVVETLKTKAEE